jgi:LPXTG-motif cell wall-anchored protein
MIFFYYYFLEKGDIVPVTNAEMIFVAIMMLIGTGVFFLKKKK